ncbi:MAG TPA: dihydroorotase [Candidatus Merdenecus merdavium]|nr:dihydroorotase [Candidatus Merdenecus merdavium]
MDILIKNGTLIDPSCNLEGVYDIYMRSGVITKVGKTLETSGEETTVIDAKGCFVMPGFIDLHVHLREPGFEYKETIESGANAGARGGFTTILAMPNTKPVIDRKEMVELVHKKAEQDALIHVLQIAAITKGQMGEELADIDGMIDAGAPGISEDGKSVMDSALYKEAMSIAARRGVPVMAHCEDITLVKGGVMNDDDKAKELGMPGISNAVEDVIVARDIALAKETGAKLHLCHCSTADSVKMVEKAKEEGLSVTAEVCPHHFILTTDDIKEDDANYKMNPPIRTKEDVKALKEGLKNDIMDVIATDHAPHSKEEKEKSIKDAPFGIVGLETCASLTYTYLVKEGYLTPMQMAAKMSYHPSNIIGLDKGSLREGKTADIVIFDPEKEYTIHTKDFVSKGKNSPFEGYKVFGQVMTTIVEGKVVYQA